LPPLGPCRLGKLTRGCQNGYQPANQVPICFVAGPKSSVEGATSFTEGPISRLVPSLGSRCEAQQMSSVFSTCIKRHVPMLLICEHTNTIVQLCASALNEPCFSASSTQIGSAAAAGNTNEADKLLEGDPKFQR
jgi:hypothetical protein